MRSSHIALLVSTSFALAAEDSPQQSISKAQAELAAFRQTKSPAALVSAYRSAQNIPELREHENWEVHRGKKLEVLLSVLKETDQAIDPKFDPERRPLRRPLFPAGALFELNSVTSPSSIQDPKLRAEYEKADAENYRYTVYYKGQSDLRETRRQCLEALGRFLKRAFPGNIRKQAETVIGPSGLTPAVKAEIEREVAKPPRRRPVRTSAEARAKIKEFERLHQSKSLHDAIGIALNLESGWPEGGRNARPMEQCRLLLLILNKGTTAVAGFSPKTKPEFPGAPKLEDFSPKERAAIAKASPEERVAILERAMEPRLAAYRQEFEKFQQQEAAYKDVEGIKKLVFDFVKEAFQTQDPKQVERLIEECITDPATQQLLKAAREAK